MPSPIANDAERQKCNIIHFDEKSGKALSEQATNASPSADEDQPKRVHKEDVLPFRDWQYVYAVPCASVAADRASAVAVLQSLACTYEVMLKSMPIEVYDRHGKIHVRATQRIEANTLVLLPCAPLNCKVQGADVPAPPNAVTVRVRLRSSNYYPVELPPSLDAMEPSTQLGVKPKPKKKNNGR